MIKKNYKEKLVNAIILIVGLSMIAASLYLIHKHR